MPFDREQIIRAVTALGFPPRTVLIHASAAMVMHGILETARDIDIAATSEGWQHALKLGTPAPASVDEVIIPAADIEIFSGWLGDDVAPLMERSVQIAGLSVASLSDVLHFKRKLNRAKDREHIRLLEAATCNNR